MVKGKSPVHVHIDAVLADAVRDLAASERRSLGAQLEIVIIEGLEALGVDVAPHGPENGSESI